MKLEAIKNVVTSKAGRQILTLQKHSPRLLFGAGIVGVIGTAVLTARATLKLDGVLEEHRVTAEDLVHASETNMPEEQVTKLKAVLYTRTAMRVVKLYGPAVVVGAASIACLTSSHHILTNRNAGLMVAYSTLEKGFNKYRERVMADAGSEKDREYMYGSEERSFVKVNKNGTEKTVVETHVDPDGPSGYAKLFGKDTTNNWNAEPSYNVLFLRSIQNYLNDRLQARGHVFLNEAYDDLGLERTPAGAVVGWVRDGNGDGFIDFGIFDETMQPKHFDFFTGREDSIWLDFNVDGVVYNLI